MYQGPEFKNADCQTIAFNKPSDSSTFVQINKVKSGTILCD